MKLTFYNTLSRKKESFVPIKKGKVGIYTCGPTVYNYAHIGNLRSYIFEDLLKRTLLFNNFKVKHIMNITDVGHLTSDADSGIDKMLLGAKRENKSVLQIAEFYTEAFKEDINKKNPSDFVLWFTKSKFQDQELKRSSPWRKEGGYPGWHIECSAMALKYLGEQFDIHCGGIDHIPVHHT